MRRTQVQLDEATYEFAQRRALSEGKSVAAVIREALEQRPAHPIHRRMTVDDFTFIGSGRSKPTAPTLCPRGMTKHSQKTSRLYTLRHIRGHSLGR